MKELRTTEDILNDRRIFTQEQADRIRENVAKEVARIKAGKKPQIAGHSRNIAVKVSQATKEAINYAYSVGVVIDLEDVKILQYIKEHGLTLAKIKQA